MISDNCNLLGVELHRSTSAVVSSGLGFWVIGESLAPSILFGSKEVDPMKFFANVIV